ncbi:UNVERIFIED_CONTAM: hypothetical protein Sradi_6446300 [Sesamum radiatum]|uniref:DUF7075 domain-containing protein n=1 Tax=Sesamum radiatum TaxID=300843 RepID=A0AAW2K4W6_SESRA
MLTTPGGLEARECRVDDPIDCRDPDVFHLLMRFENCTVSLIGMGEYHSGGNARKRKAKGKGKKEGFEKARRNILNRTLVMDLSICLSKIYSSSGVDEEGKDFRFYFDFEHLKDSASVLDQALWSNGVSGNEKMD